MIECLISRLKFELQNSSGFRNYKNGRNLHSQLTESVWLGGIYIRNEGGHEIILKSLNHYKKRLQTLHKSPELQNSAAMFASVLNQQARKTVPEIDEALEKIYRVLRDVERPESLATDVHVFGQGALLLPGRHSKGPGYGRRIFCKAGRGHEGCGDGSGTDQDRKGQAGIWRACMNRSSGIPVAG